MSPARALTHKGVHKFISAHLGAPKGDTGHEHASVAQQHVTHAHAQLLLTLLPRLVP